MVFSDLYNKTAERLLEKLEYYRNEIDIKKYNSLPRTFPSDRMIQANPFVDTLIDEVQEEFNYEMSEFQCSWAVQMFLYKMMDEYNEYNEGVDLKPRK